MLNFIAKNNARYEWDAHVLLKMHGTNLARWTACMTDTLNKGNELSIYSMCDMLKCHAFVYTRTKPWTTVNGSIVELSIPKLCMMCDIRLIYLRDNNYGKLKYQPHMMSPISSPTPQETPAIDIAIYPKDSVESIDINSVQGGLAVGILNDDHSIGTLMVLLTSPVASELEGTKALLSMKLEKTGLSTTPQTGCVETPNTVVDLTTGATSINHMDKETATISAEPTPDHKPLALEKDIKQYEHASANKEEPIAKVVEKTQPNVVVSPDALTPPERPATPVNENQIKGTGTSYLDTESVIAEIENNNDKTSKTSQQLATPP